MWEGFEVTIPGEPVPKGSLTPIVSKSTGRVILIPKLTASQRRWVRVAGHAIRKRDVLFEGPVSLQCEFVMTRPRTITPKKREHPTVPPDLDKMLRNVMDVLTGSVVKDDSVVVDAAVIKRYQMDGEEPHTWLRLVEVAPHGGLWA